MSEITGIIRGAQGTTRDKYKIIARVKQMRHGDVLDHLQSHMLVCTDPDCDICDLGESGSMIDNDDELPETSENMYNRGDRSSKGRRGAASPDNDIDTEGERASKASRGDKTNLMRHGEHLSGTGAARGGASAKGPKPSPGHLGSGERGPKHMLSSIAKASHKLLGARSAKGIDIKHSGPYEPNFYVGRNLLGKEPRPRR